HARIDDLDLFDMLLQRLGAGAVVAFEAELDVLGRDRVAIVESESLTQTELVGLAILALLPGFGEARTHLLPGIGADERVVNRVEHAERRDLCRRARRIEPGRRDRHMPGHDGASLRRRTLGSERRRRAGEDPERQQNRRHAAAQPERPHPAPPDRPMLFCQRGHRDRDCRPIYRVAATGLARPSPPGEARPSLGYFALRLPQGRRRPRLQSIPNRAARGCTRAGNSMAGTSRNNTADDSSGPGTSIARASNGADNACSASESRSTSSVLRPAATRTARRTSARQAP